MCANAFSCFCLSFNGCPGLGRDGRPVFVGTILEVTDLPRNGDFVFLSSRKARIQVNESFGGLAPDAKEVEVLTGSGGGDCGIPFKPGDVYLIDAFVGDDGLFHAGECSNSRRLDFAGAALQVLRKQRNGQEVPSLTGQIAQLERSFRRRFGIRETKPLPNTRIRVKEGDSVYETWSDAEGLYEFYDLPPGKYEFDPDLPSGTTLSWSIGSDKPLEFFTLEQGCEERNIDVYASGSIQGRVLDSSDNVLSNAIVYIVPADTEEVSKASQSYSEGQYKEGYFKFVHIPPGKYVIMVNPDDSQDPDFPYGITFYPGVHDRESAGIIALNAGEQIKGADIRVEKQFTPRHLTVRVTLADERLIRDFVSVEAKGTLNANAMARVHQGDLNKSVFKLSVLPNESYEVKAKLICRYSDDRSSRPGAILYSNEEYIRPGDGQSELFLIIPATGCPELPGKRLENDLGGY